MLGPMRVIAGHYRSRRLTAPPGTATRPTSDRLRETLFSVLGPSVAGARFADLYAGTGAVGIEALSRGATHVLFAEKAAAPLASLRENLRALRIVAGYTLDDRGTGALLAKLIGPRSPQPLAFVFLDPPYDAAIEYIATLNLLGSRSAQNVLAPGARVIAEHSSRSDLPERFGRLTRSRVLQQGDAALTFFSVMAAATADTPHPDAPPSGDPP